MTAANPFATLRAPTQATNTAGTENTQALPDPWAAPAAATPRSAAQANNPMAAMMANPAMMQAAMQMMAGANPGPSPLQAPPANAEAQRTAQLLQVRRGLH